MMNIFGEHIKVTTFGESHSAAIGGVIEGFPAGVKVNENFIQSELDRRKPSDNKASTTRKESDRIEILSGVFEGKTLGTPIAFIIRNENQQSDDYESLREIYRPGHADFTYDKKYGHYDHRSGGRASARETAARVAAGAFAKTILQNNGIEITATVKQIGTAQTPNEMERLIEQTKNEGDSLGGIVECVIEGCPVGIGEPIFGKLQAQLAEAMMSIPAAKGFEYGEGFCAATMKGSEHNDCYIFDSCCHLEGTIKPATNHSGGILGGISTGQNIVFRVAFKPIASISKSQETVDKQGTPIQLINRGRHDVCCVPRAVPVVEAMAALVIADNLQKETCPTS
ncbi:MAG: chorismate synthase [Bacteroidales bacterium]|jgi:chorismate synthase|nr:chorismate synthase [Bacteroidales bacterium]